MLDTPYRQFSSREGRLHMAHPAARTEYHMHTENAWHTSAGTRIAAYSNASTRLARESASTASSMFHLLTVPRIGQSRPRSRIPHVWNHHPSNPLFRSQHLAASSQLSPPYVAQPVQLQKHRAVARTCRSQSRA